MLMIISCDLNNVKTLWLAAYIGDLVRSTSMYFVAWVAIYNIICGTITISITLEYV